MYVYLDDKNFRIVHLYNFVLSWLLLLLERKKKREKNKQMKMERKKVKDWIDELK